MPAHAVTGPTASYQALLIDAQVRKLVVGALVGRAGATMLLVVLVLFVIEDVGSATLAGVAVFLDVAPGLVVSPVAGALLDRGRRVRLIQLDYLAAAACLITLSTLHRLDVLSPALLCLIVAGASLTAPLSGTGTRSLFPAVVPRGLWDRVNALDAAAFTVAAVTGPALAGVSVGLFGATNALLVVAGIDVVAALVLIGLRDPGASGVRGPLWRTTVAGVRLVVRDPTLRGLALVSSVVNVGLGMMVVTLPVIVITRLALPGGVIGALWAGEGVAATIGSVALGRLETSGREPRLLTALQATMAVGIAVVAVAPGVAVVAIGMVLIGVADGPRYVCIASLRQRQTEPQLLGRVIAVSVSLNVAGLPVGSVIGGAVSAASPRVAALVAAGAAVLAAGLTRIAIPRGPADGAAPMARPR